MYISDYCKKDGLRKYLLFPKHKIFEVFIIFYSTIETIPTLKQIFSHFTYIHIYFLLFGTNYRINNRMEIPTKIKDHGEKVRQSDSKWFSTNQIIYSLILFHTSKCSLLFMMITN